MLGILIFLRLVLLCKIVICVLRLGGVILMDNFYLNLEIRWFWSCGILFGKWLDVSMICLLFLYKVLNVWKNFFWVVFLLVKNWMLLINNRLMFWYFLWNVFCFLVWMVLINLFVKDLLVIYLMLLVGLVFNNLLLIVCIRWVFFRLMFL